MKSPDFLSSGNVEFGCCQPKIGHAEPDASQCAVFTLRNQAARVLVSDGTQAHMKLGQLRDLRALMRTVVLATGIAAFLAGGSALAADDQPLPPQNAKKLSEIIAKVEHRTDFRYVKEVDWDSDGYTITYYTTDKAKVQITYDPVTGEPK
ncbi:PepSY domain-containing protein [Mesorhizobium sp.]|uniref:PepSY domain-containing protein n=1 Tax=Mesorhizobium sp. TaxID=1871066 RepID=UPI0025C0D288|nr:PepSY domain-containing protein [Mesorhizobium sp.]